MGLFAWTLAALVAGVIVAFLVNRLNRSNALAYGLAIIVFILVETAAVVKSQVVYQTSPFPTATPRDIPKDAGPPSAQATLQSGAPNQPTVMATSLLDILPVAQDVNSMIDLRRSGSVSIDGQAFDRAFVYSCSMFCNGTCHKLTR